MHSNIPRRPIKDDLSNDMESERRRKNKIVHQKMSWKNRKQSKDDLDLLYPEPYPTLRPNLGCCLEISPIGIQKSPNLSRSTWLPKNEIKTKIGKRLPFSTNKIVFSCI